MWLKTPSLPTILSQPNACVAYRRHRRILSEKEGWSAGGLKREDLERQRQTSQNDKDTQKDDSRQIAAQPINPRHNRKYRCVGKDSPKQ